MPRKFPRTQMFSVALLFRFLIFQFYRSRIDAIAHAAGVPRPIVKHMPQVRLAARAFRFRADHSVRSVRFFFHAARRKRRGKTRPARAGFKFLFRLKKRLSARRANIGALLFLVTIFPREWRLRPLLPHHIILFGCKFLLPFRICLLYFFSHNVPSLSQRVNLRK